MKQHLGLVLVEQKRKQESTELRVSYNALSYRPLQSGFSAARAVSDKERPFIQR